MLINPWSKYISSKMIAGKIKWVVVDKDGNILNSNPRKEDMKGLHRYLISTKEILKLSEKEKKEYLLEFLRYFYINEGRSPKIEDFRNNPKCPDYHTYYRIFGSWNNAISEAGLETNCRREGRKVYTDEKLLKYLIQFYEEKGTPPAERDFINNPKYPGHTTYRDYFGSWESALKLVGLDIESMVRKGFINTNKQKARFVEILVKEHFIEKDKVIDLSGKNCSLHPYDGKCPKGQTYEVKSFSKFENYWSFSLRNANKDEIEWYYLLAFNEDFSKLMYVWRIPSWDFIGYIENGNICIGSDSGYECNIENMKVYEISEKIKPIFENWLNNIKVWSKEEILVHSNAMLQQYDKRQI